MIKFILFWWFFCKRLPKWKRSLNEQKKRDEFLQDFYIRSYVSVLFWPFEVHVLNSLDSADKLTNTTIFTMTWAGRKNVGIFVNLNKQI